MNELPRFGIPISYLNLCEAARRAGLIVGITVGPRRQLRPKEEYRDLEALTLRLKGDTSIVHSTSIHGDIGAAASRLLVVLAA